MKKIVATMSFLVLAGLVGAANAQPTGYYGYPGFQRPTPSWMGSCHQARIRLERDRNEEGYLLRIYTSGDIDPEAIQVSIRGNSLLIENDQSTQQEQKSDRGYYSSSRSSSRFRRRLSLPWDADADNMQRSVEDGVITIMLPRAGK